MVQKHSRFLGIAISPGIGKGKACIWGVAPKVRRKQIKVSQVPQELERLKKAIDRSRQQLADLKSKVKENLSDKESEIFDAHALFLNDPVFLAQVEKKIVEQRVNVETALEDVINASIKVYSTVEDSYLKERIQDIRDIGRRILDNLIGYNQQCILNGETEIIVVAEELTPSQLIDLDHQYIKGFITEKGGETSHSAILARSLGIPLVSGIKDILNKFEAGTPILVNGFNGEVIRVPLLQEIKKIDEQFPKLMISETERKQLSELPTVTLDGTEVHLFANIRSHEDLTYLRHFKTDGIGLYRTEMAFINRFTFPTEDEQFALYKTVVEKMAPKPVIIRSLDLGGDKFSPYYPLYKNRELNPYLGLRAIRVSLSKPHIFKMQLRAILRASAYGKVKLMLPLITDVEEIKLTKRILFGVMQDLERNKIPFDRDINFGAMIEVPSAVITINTILREVDFVSVGTNDLIQYTLAVDRSNEMVSDYYDPLHPAVILLLKQVVDAANRAKKEASICGEMAADIQYIKLLLGLGYRNLSMSSFFLPQVKKTVRSIRMDEAKELAYKVLNLSDAKKIRKLLLPDR